MVLVRVSTKGQIVIPAAIRRELKLERGVYLRLEENGTEARVKSVGDDPIDALYGMFAHLGPLTQGLLEDRREEREIEERKQAWLNKTLFRRSSSTPSP